jgi:predicted MFS family arabinose efflux permease
MNSFERQGTFSLAGIYALRMLGLFMILPVFSLYAENLEGVTPMLIGLALGIYGLTMALFQIPFGILSDRFGRKPIITVGLLLFAVGSVVAAMSDSITGVIIGRAIQGAGAIAAAMMALLADLTREEHRTKAMAIMGVSIGMSFTLALVLGPFLSNIFGVAGIFWLTAVLAIAGIGVLYLIVPDPDPEHCYVHRDAETVPAQMKQVIFDGQLLRLDLGIMIQHGIMMAMFTALPFVLRDFLGLPSQEHAWFYLPVLVLSVFGMVPLIIIAEKKQKMKQVFLGCVGLMILAECMLGLYHESLIAVAAGLLFFFVAFNALEASLPSLISRMAPVDAKGTAMGVYSTSQFFGAFVGGSFGGIAYGAFGVQGVFYACAVAALIWIVIAAGMHVPAYLSNYMTHVDAAVHDDFTSLTDQLLAVAGVHEAKVVVEDSTAYLRVDKRKFNPEDVDKLLG